MRRDPLIDKWEPRMHEWMLWDQGRGASISCAYEDRVPTGRQPRGPEHNIAIGIALDRLRANGRHGRRCYDALIVHTRNTGTRGEQAHRLGIHPDTYRARVRHAMALLELITRNKSAKPHNRTHSQALQPNHAQAANPKAPRRHARHVKA